MADPRKTFQVRACPRGQVQTQAEQAKRKGFLDSITKIGDLEILNDTGFGKVAEGLRTLAGVSDSIRSGQSVVPGRENTDTFNSTLGNIANLGLEAVDQGAQAVMDATGLGTLAESVGEFHPEVANRAVGQAKAIYQKVKQGEFELSDIPETFSDLQNLEQLGRGIFGSSDQSKNRTREYTLCGASPYAVDLISYAPKFNFLFVIDVQFSTPYTPWTDIGSTMAFVVKRSSRPQVEFEYEDVNMYNFWTKVPKKVVYPPITMSFYDDNKNAAHLFYTGYMRAMSPIANMYNDRPETLHYEQNSMNFSRPTDSASFNGDSNPIKNGYASSLGPLANNSKSILSRIRLYHVFDYGRMMNIYNFYNPRILSFTPTELNMAETGDGAEFEFQFAYDGMFIEPGFSVQEGGQNRNLEDITSNRGQAFYPIKPIFNDDDVPQRDNSQQPLAPISQEQVVNDPGSNYVGNFTGEFLKGTTTPAASAGLGDAIGNFTSGVTGAINDSVAQAKNYASNAFNKGKNFVGSLFG